MRRLLWSLLLFPPVFGLGACALAGGSSPDCEGARCDLLGGLDDSMVPPSPCDGVLVDRSGRVNADGSPIQRVAGRLGDPIAELVYQTEGGCPITFEEIMAKLAERDADGCQDGGDAFSPVERGLATRVVTEQAQLLGSKERASYRTITTRTCGGRNEADVMLASFGVDPDGTDMPGGVEIMAFDSVSGVFNYYKEVDGRVGFFGNSIDYITEGPGGPNLTSTRGCANCHEGGGPIMKELVAPWLHWEPDFPTPGTDELVANRAAFLGAKSHGINMESITRAGNNAWNRRRIEFLRESGTVADLLRPLFCPVEVNVGTGDGSSIPSTMILDQHFGFFSAIDFSQPDSFEQGRASYAALKTAVNQRVPGHPGKDDTVAPFGHIERAGADIDYVSKLVEDGIIDRWFQEAVLLVDFTRPALSDERCDLLRFAPDLPAGERTADRIRRGFIESLEQGASDPAGQQLLAFLRAADAGRPVPGSFVVAPFQDACRQRSASDVLSVQAGGQSVQVSALLADAMKIRSLQRKLMFGEEGLDAASGSATRPRKVFEFADSLATDDIRPTTLARQGELLEVHPGARLSPLTCELRHDLEPVALPPIEIHGSCTDQFSDGVCIDVDQVECPGFLQSGLCSGPASIRCCLLDNDFGG